MVRVAWVAILALAAGTGLGAALHSRLSLEAAPIPAPGRALGDDPAAPPAASSMTSPAANAPRTVPSAPSGRWTLNELLTIDSEFEQTARLYELARTAGLARLQELIEETATIPYEADRRAALSILYSRYADIDPADAVDHLLERHSAHWEAELASVFHSWARRDLDAALVRAQALEPAQRAVAGATILLARQDLPANRQQVIAAELGIENALPHISARQTAAEAWSDPAGAWHSTLIMEPGQLRNGRLQQIARSWAQRDPQSALNAIAAMEPSQFSQGLQQMAVAVWSESDPRRAAEWAVAQPPSNRRALNVAVALQSLARTRPAEAFDLAMTQDGPTREAALSGIVGQWAQADPAAAAASIEYLDNSRSRLQAISALASEYVRQDPQGAATWLDSLNQQEAQVASSFVVSTLIHQDPDQALAWMDRMTNAATRASAAEALVSNWVHVDPAAAARWVAAEPAESRGQLVTSLASNWVGVDRQAAIRYVEDLPSRAERDAAYASMIVASFNDPEFAESLYQRLDSNSAKRVAATQLYRVLEDVDPARAERYRAAGRIVPAPQ